VSHPNDEQRSNPWRRLETRIAYENPWLRLREDRVIRPDQQPGIYGVVEMKTIATGVVPIDDDGSTYLVGQYRYSLDAYSWEIPQGGGALEVAPRDSAARELQEETGIEAKAWHFLGQVHTSNCVTNEVGYLYLVRDLVHGASDPDGDERLEVERVPFDQALAMALDGRITDAMSIIGLAKADRWLRGERFADRSGLGSEGCVAP
jgi:8-oxo-dGTP pyrophosphatase MutT (NUDIX family)